MIDKIIEQIKTAPLSMHGQILLDLYDTMADHPFIGELIDFESEFVLESDHQEILTDEKKELTESFEESLDELREEIDELKADHESDIEGINENHKEEIEDLKKEIKKLKK